MRASLSDEAIEDARAAADWYVDQAAHDAADAFIDDIERSIQLLLRHPRIGAPGVAGDFLGREQSDRAGTLTPTLSRKRERE
jgi:plasmid stabilization system protein ParE